MIEQFKHFIRHGKQANKNSTAQNNITFENESKVPYYTEEKVDNDTAVARIVAEEREQRSKLPNYPGLERYRLLQKMGDGAFSNVYKATNVVTNEKVAIKVVRKRELNNAQERHLHRDMKPRATEVVFHDYYYLVLELLEGGELFHQIVRLTYFSEQLSRHVIVQVAEGIRYLHEEVGVVHRDIKPENLLFEPIPFIPSKVPKPNLFDEPKEDEGEFIPGVGGGGIGKVKIADFGLSKVVWNEQTMTPCGTVGYTAPEIVKDERYSKSVDMWALGCVLYTMLCGFPPFYDESIRDLTEKVAKGQYTFLSPWWDSISDSAKDLITHLLSVDPNKRYTINQFFEHPWVKDGFEVKSAVSFDSLAIYNTLNTPGDVPRRKDVISPGITLREALDVSCAVHRLEEESSKRRKIKIGGGGQKAGALNPFKKLNINLNEDDVSDDEPSLGEVLISNNASVNPITANESIKMKTGTRKVAGITTASAKNSKEGSKRFNFELNMDKATLLGRRRKAIAEPVGV
ncbi:17923_t:CDS:2 [Dentiscutata erythropus]|uniref:17923_t:CDS:1 n=1 Tax=Dentiscutata erythropus TaxID=1348616 RepID=A0A9N9C887_9GLOM|nr:17923_t:CDS:2 [Dentiscutata erythropus]